jgi:hypothetical protein
MLHRTRGARCGSGKGSRRAAEQRADPDFDYEQWARDLQAESEKRDAAAKPILQAALAKVGAT